MTSIIIPDLKNTIREGQTVFVPFDGITSVKVLEVTDDSCKVRFEDGKSHLLPQNVLFTYEDKEKCQQVWDYLIWIADGVRITDAMIGKRMDHVMLMAKAVNGSHIQRITAAIIDDTYVYYQDAGKPAFMMNSTAPYEDYEILISSLGLSGKDTKSYSMDVVKPEKVKDMFPLDGGIYAEWSEFYKRNRQKAEKLLIEAVETVNQQK